MALIKCPDCGLQLSDQAEKCIKCGHPFLSMGKKNKSEKKKHIGCGGLLVVIIFGVVVIGAIGSLSSKSTTTTTPPSSGPKQVTTVGQEAYLRLPNISDPSQVILLAPTQKIYEQVVKSSMANDTVGLLELAQVGVFGVSNGTKVFVIDRAVGATKVRVTRGVRPIDDDKVNRAGWVASEWVVDQ